MLYLRTSNSDVFNSYNDIMFDSCPVNSFFTTFAFGTYYFNIKDFDSFRILKKFNYLTVNFKNKVSINFFGEDFDIKNIERSDYIAEEI